MDYRLGQVENARKHLFLAGPKPDPLELQKLQEVEKHLERSADARNVGDWKSMLSETHAAIAHGADSSSLVNFLASDNVSSVEAHTVMACSSWLRKLRHICGSIILKKRNWHYPMRRNLTVLLRLTRVPSSLV